MHADVCLCTHNTRLSLSGVIKSIHMQSCPTTKQALMSQAKGVGTAMAKIGGLADKRWVVSSNYPECLCLCLCAHGGLPHS